jgi:N4-gp56 family major capsid protein
MPTTTTGVNSPQAVKRWATGLAMDVDTKSYFGRRFIGTGPNNIIERKVDLEDDAGDEIRFDLAMRLRGDMTYGDDIVEGNEDPLSFYQDTVRIDQARKGASAGGRMTRKRTLHDYRALARQLTGTYIAEWMDDGLFVYLSGDATLAAINADSKFKAQFAGNPIQAPDSTHLMYAGAATSKNTMTVADKMTVNLIERAAVKTMTLNQENVNAVDMTPVSVDGGNYFVMVMHPYNQYDLRTETGEAGWIRYQQAAATAEGRNSPLFKGGVGMIADIVLHTHKRVRRFSDYGSGGNVAASRSLLMGAQAGVIAYGAAGNGTRMTWVEKLTDADNQVSIYAGTICGWKKTRFNGLDFGVIAIDAACRNPN